MAPVIDFLSYGLEADWLLTWFPIRSVPDLAAPRIRGGTFRHKTNEDVFEFGNSVTYPLGQGAKGDGDPLAPNNVVHAFITIKLNKAGIFEADLEVHNGSASRKKSLTLPSDGRVPLLITVHGRDDDPVARDTALALQGVFVTGDRLSLISVVASVFGP